MAKALKIKTVKKIGKVCTSLRYGKSTPMMEINGRAQKTGSASPVEVMNVLATAKGGRDITVYKSAAFTSGSIHPRKLTPVSELLSADEMTMYKQLLSYAEQA